MESKLNFLRNFIQLVAIGMFAFQSIQAFNKYSAAPTVEVISEVPIEQVSKPRIFICHEETLFNYTYAKEIGYSQTHAKYQSLAGELDDGLYEPKSVSWVGNTTLSWSVVNERLYINDNMNLNASENSGNYKIADAFSKPYGKCYEVINYNTSQTLIFHITEPAHVIFEDPRRKLHHRIDKSIIQGDKIHLKNDDKGKARYFMLKLIQTKKLNKKFKCADYEYEREYADCKTKHLENNLLRLLNCIPPWLMIKGYNDPVHECAGSIQMKTEERAKFARKQLGNFAKDLATMNIIELEDNKDCQMPCTQLIIHSEESFYASGDWKGTWLYLTFKDVAEVRDSVNNYDEFSLIVEVGSSLGTDDI